MLPSSSKRGELYTGWESVRNSPHCPFPCGLAADLCLQHPSLPQLGTQLHFWHINSTARLGHSLFHLCYRLFWPNHDEKYIFWAGFCRQNIRGFVSESEDFCLESFWSTPCNITVWSCWVCWFWLMIKWVLIVDWEPQHPCMGSVTLSLGQRRCTMKLAGLLLLEAVLAWEVWNQSWVLVPCTGVTQVTTLTTGLFLSTAAFVCAPGRSWVG